MGKKYEFTGKTITLPDGTLLQQIQAVRDFDSVKAGDLGGYLEKELNLGHSGNSWVYDEARVYGDAWVRDNAQISGEAIVYDSARITDDAQISGKARVYGAARITDDAWVGDNALVYENAEVGKGARITGYKMIDKNMSVRGISSCRETIQSEPQVEVKPAETKTTGLSFIEAVKYAEENEGTQFRQKSWNPGYYYYIRDYCIADGYSGHPPFYIGNILVNDWEIIPPDPPKTVTFEKALAALKRNAEIRRSVWEAGLWLGFLGTKELVLRNHKPDRTVIVQSYRLNNEDLTATDWVIKNNRKEQQWKQSK
jgi:carbonic anhydrase/acetyltransferase-like protein (isoleucine patch superfamily)